MTDWKEDNLSAVMEYSFDYNSYIEEQLRNIDDLEERKFAKQMLLQGLGEAIKSMESKYQQLENRVLNQIQIPEDHYSVLMTIIEKKHYDPTNQTLFLMVEEKRWNQEEVEKETLGEGIVFVETIYLEADLETCHRFLQKGNFSGWKVKGEEKGEAIFQIRQAVRYREAMEKLYRVFLDNQIHWTTVNTAYLGHFFDVFRVLPEKDAGNKEDKNIQYIVDYELFGEKVKRGYIPLWNIESIYYNSVDFRLPCISEIYYEHEIKLEDIEGDGYLIQFNDDILGVRHERSTTKDGSYKIIIKSTKEVYKNWVALRIRQKQTVRSLDYSYPILSNKKKDTFSRRRLEKEQTTLFTKMDMRRKLSELAIDDFIEAEDFEIISDNRNYPLVEGMNWFVEDDLFLMDTRKVLLLKFRVKEDGNYLNDSIIQYAVSHMQLQLNEYRCVGVILS